jgi:putative toxin-antitoxin system antitoxin component (TIGR02293 family)
MASLAFEGNVADVIGTMRGGALAADVVAQLAQRVGVSEERLFEELRILKTTIKSRSSKTVALSPAEQDRLYRAEKVMTRAQCVFEDADGAKTWVIGRNRALGGVSPLSLLDTEAGYELVLDTLGRVAYGVIS